MYGMYGTERVKLSWMCLCALDVDECQLRPDICGVGTCRNTEGNYTCICPHGYQQLPDNTCMGLYHCFCLSVCLFVCLSACFCALSSTLPNKLPLCETLPPLWGHTFSSISFPMVNDFHNVCMLTVCVVMFRCASGSVPEASNKLGEWVSMQFLTMG